MKANTILQNRVNRTLMLKMIFFETNLISTRLQQELITDFLPLFY